MTEDERAQLVALGLDPDKMDPQHPDYDPDYGDDADPRVRHDGSLQNDQGRPIGFTPKYMPQFVQVARVHCRGGATVQMLAEAFSTCETTILNWRHKYPEFKAAMDEGREIADYAVVQSLYQRARGYEYKSEKVFCHEGEVIRAPIIEHVPPDVRAIMWWTKNRMPQEWKDRREIKHDGNVTLSPADTLSVAEVARRMQFLEEMKKLHSEHECRELVVIDAEATPAGDEGKD